MDRILLRLFDACLGQTYFENEVGASWAISKRGKRLFLFFEHSRGVSDWLNNLSFHAVPYRDMTPTWQCHAGFLHVWKSILPEIAKAIEDRAVDAVTIVGYSHGAALAVLCHEYVWYHRPDLRERMLGVGFGCPRVLYGCVSGEIALRWDRFYVIRNLDDLITHLPPRIFGYCHVGNLIEIGEEGRYNAVDAHRPEHYRTELGRS